MPWFAYSIPIVTVAVLAVMSAAANRRWRGRRRLPMQWSLGGKVNWTAPRPLALALTPALAALVLGMTAALARTEAEGQTAVLAAVAMVFLAAHLLHLWLIEKRPAD